MTANAFKDLGLSPSVQQALDELGFDTPTPIQAQAIPLILQGSDVIGQAQTGTGKTAAFGLPLMEYIDPTSHEVQALVLTPTRELCIQVTQALRSYAEHLDIEVVAVFGGAPIASQQAQLRAGAQVVVATVGRVMDLMSRHSLVLTSARYVVLDEADEMLDLGFIEDVEKILRQCPQGRQTLLFSATMPPPIAKLADRYMLYPETISITPEQLTVDKIEQAFVEVPPKEKMSRLADVLRAESPEQAIIFCRTKVGTDRLNRRLSDAGFNTKALHGDMSQGSRDGVMLAFKNHRLPLLVATDVAARGLDIDHVTHVINFDVPGQTETYVHRIGRTGRVGRTGRAITFVTPKERPEIARIEREAKTAIREWEPPEQRLEHAPPRGSRRKGAPLPADTGAAAEPDSAIPETTEPAEADSGTGAEAVGADDGVAAAVNGADGAEATLNGAESADGGEAAADGSRVKLFVNRGRRSGVEEEDLRWALIEGAVLADDAILDVRVLERFSFVELAPDNADKAIERLDGTRLKGNELRLELARS